MIKRNGVSMNIEKQKGFTLIELLIATVLSAFIAITAIVMYQSVQRSSDYQAAALTNMVNISNAINQITRTVKRSVGYDSITANNSILPKTSIVVTATNYGYSKTVNAAYISQSQTGPSFVGIGSDQLVVQYTPPTIGSYDCEGKEITSSTDKVVERYFVRKSTDADNTLVLACSAGRYNSTNGVTGITSVGQVLVGNLDYFHVLLNVTNSSGQKRTMSISDYKAITSNVPTIDGIQIGMLTHSNLSIGSKGLNDFSQTFPVLDQNVTLNTSLKNNADNYIYDTTIQTLATNNSGDLD